MSYSDGVISAPVSIADVKAVLGESSNDLGTLCKSSKVNRWSKYAPIDRDTIAPIADNWWSADNYGFSTHENKVLAKSVRGVSGCVDYVKNLSGFDDIVKASLPWNSDRSPKGGLHSPYRLSDFKGYDHKTECPLQYTETWEIKASLIKEAALALLNVRYGVNNINYKYNFYYEVGSTTSADVSDAIPWKGYKEFSYIVGTGKTFNINTAGGNMLPLSLLLEGGLVDNVHDRIGMAFLLPNADCVDIITSNYTHGEFINKYSGDGSMWKLIYPSIYTNQILCYNIVKYLEDHPTSSSTPYIELEAIPFIVRNAIFQGVVSKDFSSWYSNQNNAPSHLYYESLSDESIVYSAPETEKIIVKVIDDINH